MDDPVFVFSVEASISGLRASPGQRLLYWPHDPDTRIQVIQNFGPGLPEQQLLRNLHRLELFYHEPAVSAVSVEHLLRRAVMRVEG